MFPEHPIWQTAIYEHRRYPVYTHSNCSSESRPTICGMGVVPTPLNATISIAVRRRSSAGLRVRWQNFKWLKREGCWAFGNQNWVHVGLVGTLKSAMTALDTRSPLKVTWVNYEYPSEANTLPYLPRSGKNGQVNSAQAPPTC